MNADGPQISSDGVENGPTVRYRSPEFPLTDLTRVVIGAAFEVHRELGPGFLEKVHETALLLELASRGVTAAAQAPIPVLYKGQPVGLYFADILVQDSIICEIKTVDGLDDAHYAQLLHYLKATGIKLGLLLNFKTRKLQIKRMIRSR